jgi:hypothetical protein
MEKSERLDGLVEVSCRELGNIATDFRHFRKSNVPGRILFLGRPHGPEIRYVISQKAKFVPQRKYPAD